MPKIVGGQGVGPFPSIFLKNRNSKQLLYISLLLIWWRGFRLIDASLQTKQIWRLPSINHPSTSTWRKCSGFSTLTQPSYIMLVCKVLHTRKHIWITNKSPIVAPIKHQGMSPSNFHQPSKVWTLGPPTCQYTTCTALDHNLKRRTGEAGTKNVAYHPFLFEHLMQSPTIS